MSSQLAFAVLFLLALGIASADDQQTCDFGIIDGVIKENRSHKNGSALNRLHCLVWGCSNIARCVASFNTKTGACVTATLSAVPLSMMKDILLRNSSDKNWVSFGPTTLSALFPTPAVLLVMDSSYRGRNLGSKGQRLDSSDTGLTWISEGPHGSRWSALKYALFSSTARPNIQVKQGGSYLLDFTKPFTIALWIKTKSVMLASPFYMYYSFLRPSNYLLHGWNSDANTAAASLQFYPSKSFDQLYLEANHALTSHVNGANILKWRHIAAVYKGEDQYSFYLNATSWPISKKEAKSLSRVNPDIINIGHNGSSAIRGAMACISIFERALTQQEVRTWMWSCP